MSTSSIHYRINSASLTKWLKTVTDLRTVELIRWLDTHARQHDISCDDLARQLHKPNGAPYAGDSVYQLLSGRRDPDKIADYLHAIEGFRRVVRERSKVRKADFVETSLAKRLFKICDIARQFRRMQFLIGPSQIGKTTGLEEYRRRQTEGHAVYFRVPVRAPQMRTYQSLCRTLGLTDGGTIGKCQQAILDWFMDHPNCVLILDEAHQFFRGGNGLDTFEFMREIHDTAKVGVVVAATYWHGDHLGANDRLIFRQSHLRALLWVNLEPVPTAADLDLFAAHFGLPPAAGDPAASDLQRTVIGTPAEPAEGLGKWLAIIEGATAIAANQKQPLSWTHVLQSYDTLLRLANPAT